jgi:hypothetical protein
MSQALMVNANLSVINERCAKMMTYKVSLKTFVVDAQFPGVSATLCLRIEKAVRAFLV